MLFFCFLHCKSDRGTQKKAELNMLFSSALYKEMNFLQFEVDTEEVGAREVRSVDVTCIAVDTLVDVALE